MRQQKVQKCNGSNIVATATATTITPVAPVTNTKPKTFKNIVTTVCGSVGVYSVVFLILWLCGVPFIWSTFLGFGLGMMFFAYFDSVTPGNPEYSKPILLLMLIILIGSLSIRYLPESGANNSTAKEIEQTQLSSESGTVRSVGEIWFANHIFVKGDKVKVTVEYNSVQMTGGKVFEPGVYEDELVQSDGQIMFEGVATNPSKVTITY